MRMTDDVIKQLEMVAQGIRTQMITMYPSAYIPGVTDLSTNNLLCYFILSNWFDKLNNKENTGQM